MASEKRRILGSAARRPTDRRRAGTIIETALVEPNSLFREGMEHILARTQLQVVVKADAISSLLASSPGPRVPRLAILATEGADVPSAVSIAEMKRKYPDCRIVCMIKRDDSNISISLLKSGADGVMLRSINADTFVRSLELVMLGERVLPTTALSAVCSAECQEPMSSHPHALEIEQSFKPNEESRNYNLSFRELAIIRCLVQGESNKVIAHNLEIAEATVKVHVKAILRKLHVQNRTQAAIWALHHLHDRGPAGPNVAPTNGDQGHGAPIVPPNGASIRLL